LVGSVFHGARPVKYLLDRKYIGFAVKLFHGASRKDAKHAKFGEK